MYVYMFLILSGVESSSLIGEWEFVLSGASAESCFYATKML